MAGAARSEGESQEDAVYTVVDEQRDWATVWTALRSYRSFTQPRAYSGLQAAYNRSGDALQALVRLNDHRGRRR